MIKNTENRPDPRELLLDFQLKLERAVARYQEPTTTDQKYMIRHLRSRRDDLARRLNVRITDLDKGVI